MTPLDYQNKIQSLRKKWKAAHSSDKKLIEVRAKLLKLAYAKAQSQDPFETDVVQAMI